MGLERVEVLDVVGLLDRLFVTFESSGRFMGWSACGTCRGVGHHPGRSPRALGVLGGQGAGRDRAHGDGRVTL